MTDWPELLALALAVAGGWFWFDTMRAREAALRAGREACGGRGLQFLDETVALAATTVARNARGRVALRRSYRFEFSDTGNNRLEGRITLLGARVEWVSLEPHEAYTEGSTLLH